MEVIAVERTFSNERLDSYLRARFPSVSRGTIQRLIESGDIRVNGKPAKASHHPHAGEVIEVHWPKPKVAAAQPEAMPIEVLHEDADLLVLNKAPGMVVHPAAGHNEHTLVNALLHHCKGQLSGIGGVARPGIVHRLDKDTSGCLVVAKNDRTHLALSEQFSSRTVEKTYHAIVCGEVAHESGAIETGIARHPTQRKRMAVTERGGRPAHTEFAVLEKLKGATLVRAAIHTGRTHQIRVHFQHLGYPVVGDLTYGQRLNKRLSEQTGYIAPRQMLHAQRLGFIHPATGKWKTFSAAWPDDFKAALEVLRRAGE